MVSVSQLNELAAIATEVADPVRYEGELFDRLQRIVGFDVAFFKRQGGPGAVVRGLDAEWFIEQERSLLDCSHEILEVVETAAGQAGVAVDSWVLGPRGLERKNYYQVVMKPVRGRSTAFVPIVCFGESVSTLALGLTRPHRVREVELLQQLTPTLRLCEGLRRSTPRVAPAREQSALSASLTAAEREVLSFLRLGYTNAQIGRARGNAERTVRNQLSSAYTKLGVASRAEAVAVLGELERH